MSDVVRNNDLSNNQIRGIDLVVKSVSKKYPFIKGWTLPHHWEKYQAHLYINVYVDWNEVSKFYNLQFKEYYDKVKNETIFEDTSSILAYFGSYEWGSPEQTEHFEKSYNEGVKIRNLVKGLYEALPEEFQLYYTHGGMFPTRSLCSLTIDNYLDYRNKK
jgi:hypothetical protein